MFCNMCGNQLPDGSKFCNKCGNSLTMEMPQDGTAMPQVGTVMPQYNAVMPQYGDNQSTAAKVWFDRATPEQIEEMKVYLRDAYTSSAEFYAKYGFDSGDARRYLKAYFPNDSFVVNGKLDTTGEKTRWSIEVLISIILGCIIAGAIFSCFIGPAGYVVSVLGCVVGIPEIIAEYKKQTKK